MSVAKFMPKHPADLIRLIIKESAVFCVNLLREVETGVDTLCVMPHDAWEFRWMQMMISTKGKVWGDEEKKKKSEMFHAMWRILIKCESLFKNSWFRWVCMNWDAIWNTDFGHFCVRLHFMYYDTWSTWWLLNAIPHKKDSSRKIKCKTVTSKPGLVACEQQIKSWYRCHWRHTPMNLYSSFEVYIRVYLMNN